MQRRAIPEMNDLPWVPQSLKDVLTDFIATFVSVTDLYASLVPKLRMAMDTTGTRDIVDLCSGNGGSLLSLVKHLGPGANGMVSVTLTDKYPNLAAFRSAQARFPNHVHFVETPVDARSVPPTLRGFRTLLASFHHFDPPEARRILQDAFDAGQWICIV